MIKYIMSVILMVTTLTVTVGVTLHEHLCGMSGELTINIIEKADCKCESDESSCEISHVHSGNCCGVENEKVNYPVELNRAKCCKETITVIQIDEQFLSNTVHKYLIKYPTEYIRTFAIDFYEKHEIKTWEKRLKMLYSGFKDNLIKFIYLLSNFEREELPKSSL
ncbi:MAG: hypothetical protein M9949_04375 [Candidatus Kapabacteria bacterium]|nr:hypothetical protein [Candidatus Kapabacteria bacterium]